MLDLHNLSPELLLYIFNFCDLNTLTKLRLTCTKFNVIIKKSKSYNKYAIITNQLKKTLTDRCQILLTAEEKWRISHNWKIGRFKKTYLLKQYVKYMPWLNLKKDSLWISEGNIIKTYKRKKNIIDQTQFLCLKGQSNHDIVKFVNKHDYLLAGHRLGGLWLYSIKENRILFDIPAAHNSDVNCVDISSNIFVTGSRDGDFKIWSLEQLERTGEAKASHKINIGDKIWSIGISPKNTKLVIGSAGYEKMTPCHIYDLERHKLINSLGENFKKGSGILDMHWEDENTLLTCGYDTFLRKWDFRTGQCIQKWMDPHDSAYYCLASDDMYSVMCGSNVFGRVVLWDQRKISYVQMYYTHISWKQHTSSPVYSMSFDSSQLFAALDNCVACLDFTVRRGKVSDYSSDLTYEYKYMKSIVVANHFVSL